jgi:hypothetical protein
LSIRFGGKRLTPGALGRAEENTMKHDLDKRFTSYLHTMHQDLENPQSQFRKRLDQLNGSKETIMTRFGNLILLESSSKKLPVIADANIFFEDIPDNYSHVDMLQLDKGYESGTGRVSWRYETNFKTKDIQAVETWYLASQKMIESGRVIYVPLIETTSRTVTLDEQGNVGDARDEEFISSNLISPRDFFKATVESDITVSDPTVIPLFNFDIPYFENVTPSQLCQFMDDYPESLMWFRNYIQRKLLDMKSNFGSEDFAREIRKTELDIEDRLTELRGNYRRLGKTSAIELIGAQAVTWSLYIFAFINSPDNLLKVILPGGALASISVAYAKYLNEKMKLENEPLNFLLLVSKHAKKI